MSGSHTDRRERAFALLARLDPQAPTRVAASLDALSPELAELVLGFAFADVLARPGIDLCTREMLTVATLMGMGTAPGQLEFHIRAALNVGVSRETIIEILLQVAVYAGVPACMNGISAARSAFAAHDKGTDIFLTGQAAFLYLLFQKTQLLRIEADWYHMVSFSHLFTCFPTGYWLLLHYISRFFQIRKPARTPMATAAAMIFFFIWASPPFRYLAQHHRGEHDPSLFHLFCKFQKVPFLPIDHGRIGIQIMAGGYIPLSIWGILHKAFSVCQTE